MIAPKRFAHRRNKDYLARVQKLPCIVTGLGSGGFLFWHGDHLCRVEAAHVKSRGAGGSDQGNTVPLLGCLHRESHDFGQRTFEAKYHVVLAAKAQEIAELLDGTFA